LQGAEGHGREEADDGDRHEQFDQREAARGGTGILPALSGNRGKMPVARGGRGKVRRLAIRSIHGLAFSIA
jgi:hypothetical protein